jgi:hypothetical protein
LTPKLYAESAARLAAVLRFDESAIRQLSRESPASVLEASEAHGVQCLLGRALQRRKPEGSVSDDLLAGLEAIVRYEQGIELVRGGELRRLVDRFRAAGIPALLFKGAALAYTHYPFPFLRPRFDTDFLIRPLDRTAAAELLGALGYNSVNAVERDAIFTQRMFRKPCAGRVVHMLDLHWRISNRPLFRDTLSFDELESGAVPIAAVGPGAKTPCAVHSLLLASVHPVAHHHCDWWLIWLYDIFLLGHGLSSQEWREFLELAAARKVSYLCKEAFRLVSRYFGTPVWLRESGVLEIPQQRRVEEPSAAYLNGERNARHDLMLDLNAMQGLREKSRLLAAHSFPDVRYMRAAYGTSGSAGIIAAYGRRIINACLQLIRAGRSPRTATSGQEYP